MTDEIDDLIRAAAKAHEALAPADHFDGLSSRVMARLARPDEEVAMMSETNKDAPRAATPPPSSGTPERKDDSGVHDMKVLAQTAKQRISRRITSQHDAYDESLLSSSQSGLRAVALPVQAQVVSLPEMPSMPGAAEIAGAEAAGITPIEAARGKKSKAVWFIAAGGVIAAAAAAVFVISSGAKKTDEGAQTAMAAGSSAVALKDTAAAAPSAGEGMASGSAVGASMGSGAGSSATTVVAMDPGAGAAAPPAEASDKAVATGAEQHKGHAPKVESTGGRAGAGGSAGAGAGSGRAKTDVKAGGGGGGGAGGGGTAAGGGDSMEDLLAAASGGAQKPTEGSDTGPAKPAKEGLDGKDIRTGFSAVAKAAQACYDANGVAGHVKIKATVEPSGKVTKAEATGEFAGTPTGSCVAAAAKSASFPEWSGAPMTISYGFTLVE